MKTHKLKTLGITLLWVVGLLAGTTPLTALAATDVIILSGTQSITLQSDGSFMSGGTTYTLTPDTTLICQSGDLTINSAVDSRLAKISVPKGNLTISGGGSLHVSNSSSVGVSATSIDVTSGSALVVNVTGRGSSRAVEANGGALTVVSASVEATAPGTAVYAKTDIDLRNATMTATASGEAYASGGRYGIGAFAGGGFDISSSTLKATGYSIGAYSKGAGIKVAQSSIVTAIATGEDEKNNESYGISSAGDALSVDGSTVNATGQHIGVFAQSVHASNSAAITGEGDYYGIYALGDRSITADNSLVHGIAANRGYNQSGSIQKTAAVMSAEPIHATNSAEIRETYHAPVENYTKATAKVPYIHGSNMVDFAQYSWSHGLLTHSSGLVTTQASSGTVMITGTRTASVASELPVVLSGGSKHVINLPATLSWSGGGGTTNPVTPPPPPPPPGPTDPEVVTPPPPTEPGNKVVPGDKGRYVELDENDVPLGEWFQNDDLVWIFDEFPPLANLPKTGGGSEQLWLPAIGLLCMLAGLGLSIRKPKHSVL